MSKRVIIYTVISIIISGALIYFLPNKNINEPKDVYRVYLKGKSLGLISSKTELENYIDKNQKKIKNKYDVSKVYAPDELDIVRETTFDNNILSTEKVYKEIENISPFTIDGYKITIKGTKQESNNGKTSKSKDVTLYALKSNDFKKAINKTVLSFVPKDSLEAYKKDEQKEIKETGSIIENLYIKNKISIKNQKIPVDKEIFTNEDDITKQLLFGTTADQQKYTVQAGDTIEDVAFNNRISTEEFLIANTKFKDKNSLLFEGQEVTIGVMHPQFSLVEEDHTVSDQEVNYETETKYDNEKSVNYTAVEQAGVKGKNRVTQKIQKVNGEIMNIVTTKTEQISAPVKEIIVKGKNSGSYYGGAGYGNVVATKGQWGWPATCMSVSSGFGYRWGVLHDGTDIAGCGYGSNIFAALDGTVVKTGSKYDNGIYVIIDHHNGYYSLYAHLSGYSVREGQNVAKGEVIGTMGKSGFATGVHLHFAIWAGFPYYGGRALNAMSFY